MIQIQTPGGAFWQRDSVCTIAIFKPYDPIYGDGDIQYSSRKHSPNGAFNNASGTIYKRIRKVSIAKSIILQC